LSAVTILFPRYLLPVRPQGKVLTDHAVVVEAGRIRSIEPREAALDRNPGADRVELSSHVLMPGLINMHTHSAMALLRGYADDLALDTWLNEHIWPAEKRWLSAEFVRDGTELAVAEMIRCGTTCFNDMYFFPDDIAAVVERSGVRACIGLPIIEIESAWAKGFDEYLHKALDMHDEFRSHGRIETALAPHAMYTVTHEMLEQIARNSAARNMPVHLHLLEVEWEIKHSLQKYGIRPLRRLEDLGLLNSRLIAVHMAHVTDSDIALLAERDINVVHCPESNLKLASGMCPVSEMLAAGVNVSVGTDGAASNNNLDLLGELRTAALLAKGVAGDPRALDAVTAIELVTINAARALGLGDRLGSIEPGKEADFCAIDLQWPETQPVHHHISSQLVYAASSRQVTDVWVAGRRLLEDGELRSLELQDILERARRWSRRMAVH
jgi:5-methylthioadenosine/S-adenosylhomocysteine deaminase